MEHVSLFCRNCSACPISALPPVPGVLLQDQPSPYLLVIVRHAPRLPTPVDLSKGVEAVNLSSCQAVNQLFSAVAYLPDAGTVLQWKHWQLVKRKLKFQTTVAAKIAARQVELDMSLTSHTYARGASSRSMRCGHSGMMRPVWLTRQPSLSLTTLNPNSQMYVENRTCVL